jgi:AcrR family transcriptional regulator
VAVLPDSPRTRREENKARTRQAMIDAALELFATVGYDDTSTEAIAERAGVSPRTFFRYFPTKESVLFFGEYDYIRSFADVYLAQPADVSELDAIRDSFLILAPGLSRIKDRIVRYELALAGSAVLRGREYEHHAQNQAVVAGALAQRRGLDEPDEDCRLLAAVAVAVLRHSHGRWLAASTSDPRPFLADAYERLGRLARGRHGSPGGH